MLLKISTYTLVSQLLPQPSTWHGSLRPASDKALTVSDAAAKVLSSLPKMTCACECGGEDNRTLKIFIPPAGWAIQV